MEKGNFAFNRLFFFLLFFSFFGLSRAYGIYYEFENFVLELSSSSTCSQGGAPYPFQLPEGCSVVSQQNVCAGEIYTVGCELEMVIKMKDDKVTEAVINNVMYGHESEVAEQAYQEFAQNIPYKLPPEGFYVSGMMEGYAYVVLPSNTPGYADVRVTMWKHANMARIGTDGDIGDPIGDGSGGSGGGSGLTAEDVQAGVEAAIESKFGTSEGSGSFSETPIETYSSDLGGLTPEYTVPSQGSLTSTISGFFSSNPLLSIFSSSAVSATAGQCSFSTSIFGSNIDIDFCPLSEYVEIFGYFVFLVATIYSFFIAWGRA